MASLPRLTDASLAEIEQRSEMADKIALPWLLKTNGRILTHHEVVCLCLAVADVSVLLAEVRALRTELDRLRREFEDRFERKVQEMSDATGSMMVDLTRATVENQGLKRDIERLAATHARCRGDAR